MHEKKTDKGKIDFVYKIKEEDIFRPTLYVYGLDREKRTVYGSRVRFYAKIAAGYYLARSKEQPAQILCGLGSDERFARTDQNLKFDLTPNWELMFLERIEGADVIKVGKRRDLKDAIEFHGSMYASQFEEASRQALGIYIQTILSDPRLGYNDIPISLRSRS